MNLLFVIILLFIMICLSAGATEYRPSLSLDGKWNLYVPDKQKDYSVTVPGPWEAQVSELRDSAGKATYSREFEVPESWQGKKVYVKFGAVDYYADVYVNSAKVGNHEGGYTPFEFEIQGHIKFGEKNTIKVDVVDPGLEHPVDGFVFEEIPHGKQSWYGNNRGIWQSVCLEARNAAYIKSVVVDPDIDVSAAQVKVNLANAVNGVVRLSVVSPKDAEPVAGVELEIADGLKDVSWKAGISDPVLWSPDTPALYTVKAEMLVDGEVVDLLETTFGMRKIEAKDGKIFLNNQPIFIAGALDQDFYPGTEYAVPSDEFLKNQFVKAKHLGLNMLRCHIKVPDPRYLEWADELGLLVWYEIPNWINLTDDSKRRARQTLDEMLERDHNHPSLVVVSIINEAWGVNVKEPEHRKWMAEMYDYAKSLEPNRLIVDNSACGGNFHVKTDIDDFHIYFQIPDTIKNCKKWMKEYAGRPAWTFTSDSEGKRRGDEPLLLSEFGNWGLPRISSLNKGYNGVPWWFATGRGSVNTHPAGIEERFEEWQLDKVFGTMDKLSEEFQEQEWRALKFQIEEMRQYSSIIGYVITEFTDLHWESNGLLDMCRNPKTFYNEMHNVQDQDIVFTLMDKFNHCSGEPIELPVYISHFTQQGLEGSRVEWRIEKTELRGVVSVDDEVTSGSACCVGNIKYSAPGVASPQRMRLHLSLVGPNGRKIAGNYQEFNVFPLDCPKVLEDVIVTAEPDKALFERIKDGANAVICVEFPMDIPELAGVDVIDRSQDGRWGGWCNCLTWFKDSQAFNELPVSKVMDFSFEDVIPKSVITGIEPEHWGNDVLSGLFVGWVQSNAAVMAQFRHGQGKAVITTLPLISAAENSLTAKFLLASVARYVDSAECKPVLEL